MPDITGHIVLRNEKCKNELTVRISGQKRMKERRKREGKKKKNEK